MSKDMKGTTGRSFEEDQRKTVMTHMLLASCQSGGRCSGPGSPGRHTAHGHTAHGHIAHGTQLPPHGREDERHPQHSTVVATGGPVPVPPVQGQEAGGEGLPTTSTLLLDGQGLSPPPELVPLAGPTGTCAASTTARPNHSPLGARQAMVDSQPVAAARRLPAATTPPQSNEKFGHHQP